MAGRSRIEGITVEIGGDVTGLSKALSGTNKEIKNTQANLRDVERLLKLDPKNTELLRQKQQLLGQEIGETKTKLDALKDAEKQVQQQFENGEISQERYDALKREIEATENQLNELEKAAKNSNVTLSQISATAEKVADATGNLAQKTKGLSMAAAGGLVSLGTLAYKAGQSADEINTLAKQTGLSTEEIQKFQYASDIIDVDLNTLTKSMAKLTKNMATASKGTGDVAAAFEALGIEITDSNGELRNNQDVFDETIEALAGIENETQRDAYAMQIFGKSAQDLNPLILGGADSLKELGEQAEAAGLILSQEALDSANEFNDAIDSLKATATGTFAEVGTEIATMLIPYMDDLGQMLKNVMEWMRGLDEGQLKMIGTILLVIAAISPMFSTISKLAGVIQLMSGTVIPGLGSALSFIAANPIVLLIAAIIGLVALIATKGDEIQALLQKFDDFLQGIFAKDWKEVFGPVLGEALNGFFANLKNIWDSIKKIFDGIIDFIKGVFTGDWERAWTGVKKIFCGIFEGLASIAKVPINGIITILNGAINGINTLIRGLNNFKISVPNWVPKLGGKSFQFNVSQIGNIPYLYKGGELTQGSAVVGEAGPELLTQVGNRSIVQPLTSQTKSYKTTNLGGVQILVYGAPGQDVKELADIISERLDDVVTRKEAVYG